MSQQGYVSPLFVIISGVFIIVLVATVALNAKSLDFGSRASETVKKVNLLPSENVDISCGNGGKLKVVKSGDSAYQLSCTGFLPSN